MSWVHKGDLLDDMDGVPDYIEVIAKPAESAPAPMDDVSQISFWMTKGQQAEQQLAASQTALADALKAWEADKIKLAAERERAEVSRSLRDIDAANLRGADTRAEIANIRAEQAESELKELTRISDESDEHQTWNAYYVSELERRLTPEQIAAARVALHERWQTVPHVDEQYSVVARIQKAESALADAQADVKWWQDHCKDWEETLNEVSEKMVADLADARKENERLRDWLVRIADWAIDVSYPGDARRMRHMALTALGLNDRDMSRTTARAALSYPPSGQKEG